MSEPDDHQLLAEYARDHSETAFAALVRRHLNLVYSTALRSIGNAHAAEEVSQAVFLILARKAKGFSRKIVLSGWLYQTARLTAANFLRGEIRRQQREQEACMQSTLNEPAADPWPQIAPILDGALEKLGEADRNAIVLRFMENKSLREVGLALGASEDAAKVRVARALEKLRKTFTKRGVTLTVAVIAGTVTANSVSAAPAGLAATVTVAAQGVGVSTSTLTLIKGALKVMAWTKVKITVLARAGLLLAAGATIAAVKEIQLHQMYAWRVKGITPVEIAKLDTWPAQVWIGPAKDVHAGYQLGRNNKGKLMGRNTPFSWLLSNAYGKTQPWMILPNEPGDDRGYDYMANLDHGSAEALQREIEKTFGVVVRRELRETNVLILKIGAAGAHGIKPPTANSKTESRAGRDAVSWFAQPLSTLDVFLEDIVFHTRIIDQTGLTQNYDFSIKGDELWWSPNHDEPEVVKQKLLDQLGLELVPTNMPVEMLIVEKVK